MLLVHGVLELLRAPGVADLTVVVPGAWRPLVAAALDAGEADGALRPRAGGRPPHGIELERRAGDRRGPTTTWSPSTTRRAPSPPTISCRASPRRRRGTAPRCPAIPVHDTVVQLAEDGVVAAYLDRGALAAVQTPQVFRYADLRAAHAWCAEAGLAFTDDGGLLAARGLPPVVVAGEDVELEGHDRRGLASGRGLLLAAAIVPIIKTIL